MLSEKVKQIFRKTPKRRRYFVDYSMEIASQIHHTMSKNDINQEKLARLLDKKPSEISKWLSGGHNFTIKTIAKISEILNTKLILVPLYAQEDLELSERSNPSVFIVTVSNPITQSNFLNEFNDKNLIKATKKTIELN